MSRLSWFVLTATAGVVTPLLGQDPVAPLSLEALLTAPRLAYSEPSIAPDGSAIVYAVIDNARRPSVENGHLHRTGVPWFALGGDIWISRISGGGAHNLTAGRGNNWAPAWSPDGRRVAFLSDRSGGGPVNQAHLWIWEEKSGKLRRAADLPVMDPGGKLGRLEWLQDSRTVVVKAYSEGMSHSTPKAGRRDRDMTATAQVLRFDPGSNEAVPRAWAGPRGRPATATSRTHQSTTSSGSKPRS